MSSQQRNRQRSGLRRGFGVTLSAFLAGLLLLTPIGSDFEESVGLGTLFQLRGPLSAPPSVVIIAVDRASAATLGLPEHLPDWSRSVHARLVDFLAERGAAAIVFDVIFSPRGPRDDSSDFVRALRKAGNVVLLQGLERRPVSPGPGGRSPPVVIDTTVDPVPALAAAAAGVAPFPLPKVPARVDRFWVFRPDTDRPTVPAVALQLAMQGSAAAWAALLATERELPNSLASPASWTGKSLVESMIELRRRLRQSPNMLRRFERRLDGFDSGKSARLRRLIGLYSGEGDRPIDFRGPAGTVLTLPYADLIAGTPEERKAAAQAVAGRVAVIGVDERDNTNQLDAYHTVFSGENGIDVTGVEILATAIADLIEEASLRAPLSLAILLIFLVALSLGLAAAPRNAISLAASAIGTPLAHGAIAYQLFVSDHLVLPLAVPVLVQVPCGILVAIWLLRAEERRLRSRMATAVRQFLPEKVAQSLAEGPLPDMSLPPGEVRYAICLATDAEHFTALAERLSPEAMGQLLSEYLRLLFGIIQRRGGVIEHVSGDSMMCVWTASEDILATRRSAALAALEILDAVAVFNRKHDEARLPTRIGLHAGTVRLGAIGGAGHFTFAVVGDVANTASRIEKLNKHLRTSLLASQEALENVEGLILRPVTSFLLAGKSRPVEIAEILGIAGEDDRAAALAEHFADALVSYRQRRWEEAAERLEQVLGEYPADGPALFLLDRVRAFLRSPPPATEEVLIRLEEK
jgi:adenylate cyclase